MKKKRNHYVPVLHLKGFTPSGSEEDTLQVHDLKTGEQHETNPRGAGLENHLYRVDDPRVDPTFVEEWLARFVESPAASIFRDIESKQELVTGNDYMRLMVYISTLALRGPAFRGQISDFLNTVGKQILHQMVKTPERWAVQAEKLKAEGITPPEYEKVKAQVENEVFSRKDVTKHFIRNMVKLSKQLTPLLAERQWTLWIAEKGAGEFICSDRPVAINSLVRLPPLSGPGYANKFTIVTMPLSRNMAMEGRFEGHPKVSPADGKIVAIINGCTAWSAERFLFTTQGAFCWSAMDGVAIKGWEELLEARARTT